MKNFDSPVKCPHCQQELIADLPRWNSKAKCPKCSQYILIVFDFSYDPDSGDQEEFDFYMEEKITEGEFKENWADSNIELKIEE